MVTKSVIWPPYLIFNVTHFYFLTLTLLEHNQRSLLREKCPNMEFFLVCIFLYSDWIRRSLYLVRIQENTDQKKLRIWTLFKQWFLEMAVPKREANSKNFIKKLVNVIAMFLCSTINLSLDFLIKFLLIYHSAYFQSHVQTICYLVHHTVTNNLFRFAIFLGYMLIKI